MSDFFTLVTHDVYDEDNLLVVLKNVRNTVRSVVLNRNVTISVLDALALCTEFQSLFVNNPNMGADAFSRLVRLVEECDTLSSLSVANCNLGDVRVSQLMAAARPALTKINLDCNNLTRFPAPRHHLRVLNVSNNHFLTLPFCNAGVLVLNYSTIGEMDLRGVFDLSLDMCHLDDDNAGTIAEYMSGLQRLSVRGNLFASAGLATLAQALATNTSLRHLDLSLSNYNHGVWAFAPALQRNKTLQRLTLPSDVTHACFASIAMALQENPALRYVSAKNCVVQDTAPLVALLARNSTITSIHAVLRDAHGIPELRVAIARHPHCTVVSPPLNFDASYKLRGVCNRMFAALAHPKWEKDGDHAIARRVFLFSQQ